MMDRSKRHTRKGIRRRLRNLGRAMQLIWSATRWWTVAGLILLLLQGLLPASTVYLTKVLVDSLAQIMQEGLGDTPLTFEVVAPLAIPAGLMVAVLLLMQGLKSVILWVRTAQSELIQDHVKALIHRQAAAVDLEFYEDPAYFDHLARANGQADSRILSLLENLGGLVQHTATLFAIAALLIPYGAWLPVLLVVSTLPALWVVLHHSRLHHDWWEETTERRRWTEYFDLILTARFFAPEIRLFGLHGHFQGGYETVRRGLRKSRLRLVKHQTRATFTAGLVALAVMGGAMGWMLLRALRGAATLGDVALFYQAFNQGQGLMRLLLNSVGQLYSDSLFLDHLFTFLDLKPRVESPEDPEPVPVPLRHGIEIDGVSFRYPGSEQLALKDFSLFIPAGKTVAIVGPNGAGKSTLLKLICRFYDPEAGQVRLDGVDLRAFNVDELWSQISALHQYHANYAGLLGETITLGNRSVPPSQDRIEEAARAGGAMDVVHRLPKGLDTMMGKQFEGGIDLSGGQWQRVALARVFYRQAQIVLLDEPTSYMDSWAETRWIERFCREVAGRTALIVTHRFTTAMRADLIYVVDEGHVVEHGSHAELLAAEGLYAASWRAQVEQTDGGMSTGDAAPPAASYANDLSTNGRADAPALG